MEGISLFLWILHEKGSHESYYHANTEKRSPPGNPRRNSRLGRTIPNQPAAPATPGAPVVDLQYKKREASLLLYVDSGNVLLSRAVSSQVPSALKGLTSVFGMGTGGTPSPSSPETVNFFFPRTLTTAQLFDLNFFAFSPISLPRLCVQSSPRPISIIKLHPLPNFHR